NIMLGEFGEVFVLDWGVAKVLADEPAEIPDDEATQIGDVVGTPAYMAPEQAMGSALDGRADVFTLGCVLRELLTLRRPGDDAPPLRDCPPELDELCTL